MSAYIRLRTGSLCLLYCFSQPTFSESNSSISAEVGADDSHGNNYYLSARHQFSDGPQLSAEKSKSQNGDSGSGETSSDAYTIGVKSDPSARLSLGLDISHAQQADNLIVDAIILKFEINTLNWNLIVSPESREVALATNINQRTYYFVSDGYLVGAVYYGWYPAYLSLSHSRYDYPAQISTFSSRPILSNYIFGSSTVNQVLALEDKRSSLEAGYLFNNATISLSYSQGHSVIDQSISSQIQIYLGYRLSSNWHLNARAGRSRIDTSDSNTNSASLGVIFSW